MISEYDSNLSYEGSLIKGYVDNYKKILDYSNNRVAFKTAKDANDSISNAEIDTNILATIHYFVNKV